MASRKGGHEALTDVFLNKIMQFFTSICVSGYNQSLCMSPSDAKGYLVNLKRHPRRMIKYWYVLRWDEDAFFQLLKVGGIFCYLIKTWNAHFSCSWSFKFRFTFPWSHFTCPALNGKTLLGKRYHIKNINPACSRKWVFTCVYQNFSALSVTHIQTPPCSSCTTPISQLMCFDSQYPLFLPFTPEWRPFFLMHHKHSIHCNNVT